MTGTDPQDGPDTVLQTAALAPRRLEDVIAALRHLAIASLDIGEPLAAARIAGLADQLDATTWPTLPPRPGYR